jgi:hypothetical protein
MATLEPLFILSHWDEPDAASVELAIKKLMTTIEPAAIMVFLDIFCILIFIVKNRLNCWLLFGLYFLILHLAEKISEDLSRLNSSDPKKYLDKSLFL